MTSWFTADPHFDHKRIIELCKRPFSSIDEMNRHLINEYNKYVKSSDVLYLLGDLAWGNIHSVRSWRDKINCNNIVFIWGNHDHALRENPDVVEQIFSSNHDILDIRIGSQELVLCHYPMLEWNKFWHGSWQLFGHVHGNLTPPAGYLSCDVGVDVQNYKPVSYEQLGEIMKNRKLFNAKNTEDFVK